MTRCNLFASGNRKTQKNHVTMPNRVLSACLNLYSCLQLGEILRAKRNFFFFFKLDREKLYARNPALWKTAINLVLHETSQTTKYCSPRTKLRVVETALVTNWIIQAWVKKYCGQTLSHTLYQFKHISNFVNLTTAWLKDLF